MAAASQTRFDELLVLGGSAATAVFTATATAFTARRARTAVAATFATRTTVAMIAARTAIAITTTTTAISTTATVTTRAAIAIATIATFARRPRITSGTRSRELFLG